MAYNKKRSLLIVFSALLIVVCQQTSVMAANVDMYFCEQNPILYSCINTCPSVGSAAGSGTTSASSTPGDGGGCGGTTQQNKDQIWGFLKSKGLSDEAAAGIMGNIQTESTFNPKALNSIGCLGIAQWCDRRTNLESFAAERGRPADCLGVQLEFMWHELTETGESAVMKDLTAAGNARDAGNIFAEQYERMKPEEQVGRDTNAEKIFEEYTGKPGSAPSNPSDNSQGGCTSPTSVAGGPIPSANCKAVQDAFKSAKDAGRITIEQDGVDDDVAKCSDEKLPRPTCPADTVGARPQTVRGLIAVSQNAGVDSIRLWNINEHHGCDRFEHPIGLASDIKQANGVECDDSNPEECKKVFDYLVQHGDELGVDYVMWYGSYCTQQKAASPGTTIYCREGHNNHIHVSFKDS